jgi:hypothetical protein
MTIDTVREIVEYYAQASDQWTTTTLNCEWVCHFFEGKPVPLNTLLKDLQLVDGSLGFANFMHFVVVRSEN